MGITGMLDAMAAPEGLPVYDLLLQRHHLTVRTSLDLFYDPEEFRLPSGKVDYDAMVARAGVVRARYASSPLLRADTVKLFADGVLEGNPLAVPPTLPDSPSLKPYLQPLFGADKGGRLTVTGYVDTGSAVCTEVRADPARYAPADATAASASRTCNSPVRRTLRASGAIICTSPTRIRGQMSTRTTT